MLRISMLGLFAIVLMLASGVADAGLFKRKSDAEVLAEIREMNSHRRVLSAAAWPLRTHPAALSTCGQAFDIGIITYVPRSFENFSDEVDYEALGIRPAQIAHVFPGSPAEAAGLRDGDVVRVFNGKKVKAKEKGDEQLAGHLEKLYRKGGVTRLVVDRNGREIAVEVQPVPACDFDVVIMGGPGFNDLGSVAGADLRRLLLVHKAFMDIAEGEADYTAIAAHEIAHQLEGHIKKRNLKASLGSAVDMFVPTGGLAAHVMARTFQSSDEMAADARALSLLAQAGLPTDAYREYVLRTKTDKLGPATKFLGAHPMSEAREQALR